ncbi:MAG: SCO5389 family protein [Mycobacteriales bacterium]
MSLTVSPELLTQAQHGEVSDERFADCIRTSLPYAYHLVADLAERQRSATATGKSNFVYNQVPPPDEQAQGQLLRVMASDAMRAALQRHFGVRLAFRNCHAVGVFDTGPAADAQLAEFASTRSQLLNQSPELLNC